MMAQTTATTSGSVPNRSQNSRSEPVCLPRIRAASALKSTRLLRCSIVKVRVDKFPLSVAEQLPRRLPACSSVDFLEKWGWEAFGSHVLPLWNFFLTRFVLVLLSQESVELELESNTRPIYLCHKSHCFWTPRPAKSVCDVYHITSTSHHITSTLLTIMKLPVFDYWCPAHTLVSCK